MATAAIPATAMVMLVGVNSEELSLLLLLLLLLLAFDDAADVLTRGAVEAADVVDVDEDNAGVAVADAVDDAGVVLTAARVVPFCDAAAAAATAADALAAHICLHALLCCFQSDC